MTRIIPVLLLGALLAAVDASVLQEQVATVLEQTLARQEGALRTQLEDPFPPSGMWHHEDFALSAYWLQEQTAKADEGIVTLKRDLFPAALESFEAGGFHWHAYLQQRIYFLFSSRSRHFPGRMGLEAENAILEMLWSWASPVCRKELALPEHVWWYWGSENHHLMAWVSFWGAAQIFKDHPEYRNRRYADGSTPAEMAAAFDEYFKAYTRERATKGLLVEIASPTYAKYSLNTWYNLADFAEDPVLRRRANMLLDVYWADWAIEQIDGVRGGSRHRSYPGRSSNEQSGGAEAAWYHFGLGVEASRHPGAMGAATTFWRPSPVVVELVLDTEGRGDYAYLSRRPGLKEPGDASSFVADASHPLYTANGIDRIHPQGGALLRASWCTPDFVMGMSLVEPLPQDDWTGISGQNHWNGVIFAGHPTARIFTQPRQPSKGSVYNAEWGVQSKGVIVLQRLRASNAAGQMIWFDLSLKRDEKDGWIFAEAPNAYAAIRVVRADGRWEPDSIAQRRDGKGRDGLGEWFALSDQYSPIIIEVVGKKEYDGFAAFQEAILRNPLSWNGIRVEYQSLFYETTVTLPVDASSPPLIDGAPVEFEPDEVYKSPYLNADFGEGVVEIQKGGRSLTLDFTRKTEDDPHTAVLEEDSADLPQTFTLEQNYPNPFNSGSVIRFALPTAQRVRLTVYSLAGQQVATLVQGVRQAGSYAVNWDGRDGRGQPLATGVYLYRLQTAEETRTEKLLLLR